MPISESLEEQSKQVAVEMHEGYPEGWLEERDERKANEMWLKWAAQRLLSFAEEVWMKAHDAGWREAREEAAKVCDMRSKILLEQQPSMRAAMRADESELCATLIRAQQRSKEST